MIIDENSPGHQNLVVIDNKTGEAVGLVLRIDTTAGTITRLLPQDESVPVHLRKSADYLEVTESLINFTVKSLR